MLDDENANKSTHTHGHITVSTDLDRIEGMLPHIRNMIQIFSFVQVVVYTGEMLLKYDFENGVVTRHPDRNIDETMDRINALMEIDQYITQMKYQLRIKVNHVDIPLRDQYIHIKRAIETALNPLYVSFNSGTINNRQPWQQSFEVKASEIQGLVSGVDISEDGVYCTVEMNTSPTVHEILTATPPILAGLYAKVEGRCVKLIRMFVRPMYTHEIKQIASTQGGNSL